MSESFTLELTKSQLDHLVRGLRYVRSSYMLEPNEPTEEVLAKRTEILAELSALNEQLQQAK